MSRNTRKVDNEESEEMRKPSADICKNCGNPIINPTGDNGCGVHNVDQKPVTNCIPLNG